MNRSNEYSTHAFGTLRFGGTPVRSTAPTAEAVAAADMVVHNPAPDASEPAVSNGIYQEIKFGR